MDGDDDLCGSDHFPTILKTLNPGDDPPLSRRNFARADWALCQTLCTDRLTHDVFENSEDPIQLFSDLQNDIADQTIPKSSAVRHIRKPWFNNECKQARKCRKKAEKYFRRHPTVHNLDKFKILNA